MAIHKGKIRQRNSGGTYDYLLPETTIDMVNGLQDELDKLGNELSNLTVLADEFIEIGDNNDIIGIQRAIDFVESNGGGNVLLTKTYEVNGELSIKSNVTVSGNGRELIRFSNTTGNAFKFHSKGKLKNLNIRFQNGFNGSILLFSTENFNSGGQDTVAEKLNISMPYNVEFTDGIGIHFKALVNGNNTGFAYVVTRDIFLNGIYTNIVFETIGASWVNANVVRHITARNFRHYVVVKQSSNSLGIDSNICNNLIAQLSDSTTDMIIDRTSNNIYQDCNFIDIQKRVDIASLGYAKNLNHIGFNISPHILLANTLYQSHNYIRIGSFATLTDHSRFVVLQIKGRYLDVDSEIIVTYNNLLSTPQVLRKHSGKIRLDNSKLKFFVKQRVDGLVELYMKAEGINYDVNVHVISAEFFTPYPTYEKFETITGSIEITNNVDSFSAYPPICKISKTSTGQSIINNVDTTLTFTREIDTDSMFDTSNNSRITIKYSGTYRISSKIAFTADANGYRRLRLRVNGNARNASVATNGIESIGTAMSFDEILVLNSGDYLEVDARQTSGSALDIVGQSYLSVQFIGGI